MANNFPASPLYSQMHCNPSFTLSNIILLLHQIPKHSCCCCC